MSNSVTTTTYDKNNPFPARIVERRRLTTEKSQKETVHFAISIAGSGLSYRSGDSLGVYPTNNPVLVDALVRALGATGDEIVQLPRSEEKTTLRAALLGALALAGVTRKFVELLAERAADAEEKARLQAVLAEADPAKQKEWIESRQFVDLLEEFPSAKLSAQEFVDQLRKLVPRLYSISSSPAKHPEEIHLTIAVVRYQTNGREREGVCSNFLAHRVSVNAPVVPVFVASSHFGPPEDNTVPVIMVGPGTGVAPFRSFLQEREVRGATGKNWLFFGDQHRESDFLYAEEWEAYLQSGLLTKLSTAFSRDQAHKIYVQDRMREEAEEIWQWLEAGAYFYVCGDAKRMAKDVDAALLEVVATQGKMSSEAAAEYVKQLKKDKRYQRDVY